MLTTTATYDYEPRPLEHRQQWFDDHERGGYAIFVAVEKAAAGLESVLGWSALNRYHDRMGFRFTSENSVYVASSHRGRGIGKQLLAPLIPAARARGLRSVIAAIDASNTASLRLHEHFGFVPVGLFRRVGYKFDRWLDVAYLELELPGAAPVPEP